MSATAVVATEHAVTRPTPKRNVIRSDMSAETIVPKEITVEIPPAQDTGTPKAGPIVGHAAPRSPSGNPKLTKAK
jgi:hypothetical protein